jgi:NAD(P)H-hydrate repair Nnr-like enzyme with NAD(P)H-hydrate epimerase domain
VVVLAGPATTAAMRSCSRAGCASARFDVATVFRGRVERLPRDAAAAYAAFTAPAARRRAHRRGAVALAVDGLFGLGLSRAPRRSTRADRVDQRRDAPRLALDVPSGIDADTGASSAGAVHATATATFLAWKPAC